MAAEMIIFPSLIMGHDIPYQIPFPFRLAVLGGLGSTPGPWQARLRVMSLLFNPTHSTVVTRTCDSTIVSKTIVFSSQHSTESQLNNHC